MSWATAIDQLMQPAAVVVLTVGGKFAVVTMARTGLIIPRG
jgi:hypothetical protein